MMGTHPEFVDIAACARQYLAVCGVLELPFFAAFCVLCANKHPASLYNLKLFKPSSAAFACGCPSCRS